MRLRFALLVLTLAVPTVGQAQSYPTFTISNGLQCQPYLGCETNTQCEGTDTPVCAEIATGDLACVPDTHTKFSLVCCENADQCEDADGNFGTCTELVQPLGDPIRVCVWNTFRDFSFCRASTSQLTYSDIDACLGDSGQSLPLTLAQRLLVGDCDDDGTLNSADFCPCEFGTGSDGCFAFEPDGGVSVDGSVPTDGSTVDANVGADSGPVVSAQTTFGGGSGCEGCHAGSSDRAPGLTIAALAVAALVSRRRRR